MASTPSSGKEVVVRLRVVGDEGSSRAAAERATKVVESTQDKIRKEYAKTASIAAKEADKAAKEQEKAAKAQEREADRIHTRHRERTRSIAAENRKAREATEKEAEKATKAQEREAVKIAKAHERAAAQTERKWADASFKIATAGVRAGQAFVQSARAIALFGIASEKDTEKAIRAFAKMEAAIQAISAIVNMVRAARLAWDAYTVSVLAASAANTKAAITGAAAGAAGGPGGTGALSGLAGLAGRGLKVAGRFGVAVAAKIAIPLAAGAIVGEGLSRIATGGRDGTVSAAYQAWQARNSQKASEEKTARMMEDRVRRNDEIDRRGAFEVSQNTLANVGRNSANQREMLTGFGAPITMDPGTKRDARENEIRRRQLAEQTRGYVAGPQIEFTPQGPVDRAGTNALQAEKAGEQVSALEEAIQLEQQRIDIHRAGVKEAIEAEQKLKQSITEKLEMTKRELELTKSERQSVAQNILGMSGAERVQAEDAAKRARDPFLNNQLSEKDVSLLRRTGASEFDDTLAKNEERLARERGGGTFLDPIAERQRNLEAKEQKLTLDVKTKNDLIIKLEADGQAEQTRLISEVTRVVTDLLAKREEAMIAQIEAIASDRSRQDTLARDLQASEEK